MKRERGERREEGERGPRASTTRKENRTMQSVTFKCITPYASRVYHDVDPVGEVYRLADCTPPGSQYYVIHLDEDFHRVRGRQSFAHPLW